MALEYRNGRPYYYRKVRQGNKVISEYVASGESAMIAAELESDQKYSENDKKESIRKERALHCQADERLNSLEKTLNKLFTAVAIANGYHKPKRQWRRKRQN